jgi:EcoRII C terminal
MSKICPMEPGKYFTICNGLTTTTLAKGKSPYGSLTSNGLQYDYRRRERMNWGNLNRGFRGAVTKRLSSHEVDPSTSNGHEFQGTLELQKLLGTEEDRNRATSYYFISDDGAEPKLRASITAYSSWWYRIKKRKSGDYREWRLYYPATVNLIYEFCRDGDLLLLALRNDGSRAIFLAPAGSVSEQVLLQAFGVRNRGGAQDPHDPWLVNVEPSLGAVEAEAMEQLALTFAEADEDESKILAVTVEDSAAAALAGDEQVEKVAEVMLERWPDGKLGRSDEVVKIVVGVCDPDGTQPPDTALEHWLEVAEAAYRIWEKDTANRFIGPLRADPAVSDIKLVEEIGTRWMSFRQSRVTRAGKVMEYFLRILFDRAGLKFVTDSAAKTENGKMPDFLFPDGPSYADRVSFPDSKLRILGAKTTFKDRWRQILEEGDRVRVKHGVTRDPFITETMFAQMNTGDRRLIVVMPKPIIDRYTINPPNLVSLADFINEVHDLQTA